MPAGSSSRASGLRIGGPSQDGCEECRGIAGGPARTPSPLRHVKVESAGLGLAQIQRAWDSLTAPVVFHSSKGIDLPLRIFNPWDADHQVDDRLRPESRDGRAAYLLHPVGRDARGSHYEGLLLLEQGGPTVVVIHNPVGWTSHRSCLLAARPRNTVDECLGV